MQAATSPAPLRVLLLVPVVWQAVPAAPRVGRPQAKGYEWEAPRTLKARVLQSALQSTPQPEKPPDKPQGPTLLSIWEKRWPCRHPARTCLPHPKSPPPVECPQAFAPWPILLSSSDQSHHLPVSSGPLWTLISPCCLQLAGGTSYNYLLGLGKLSSSLEREERREGGK